ncbi:MAG: ankyrin repeat domain-containing protein, partial [Actinomycetota bacterium]|nr:ankyrin repeat domain-containing protein [Actinomycetota bacterium]
MTSLLLAATKGKVDTVRSLLSNGADINHVDSKGRTSLD